MSNGLMYGRGITKEVVSSKLLQKQQWFESYQQVAKFLREQGYVKYDKQINVEGVRHNVWFKGISKNKVNAKFRASLVEKTEG